MGCHRESTLPSGCVVIMRTWGLAQCQEGREYWPRGIAAKVQMWSQGACGRHHRIIYILFGYGGDGVGSVNSSQLVTINGTDSRN